MPVSQVLRPSYSGRISGLKLTKVLLGDSFFIIRQVHSALSLRFVPAQMGSLVMKMEQQPKFKAGIGNGDQNPVIPSLHESFL